LYPEDLEVNFESPYGAGEHGSSNASTDVAPSAMPRPVKYQKLLTGEEPLEPTPELRGMLAMATSNFPCLEKRPLPQFSIPINEAKRVIEEIISTGKSTRPVLGVFFDTNFTGVGARILRLSPGEGAERAGIPAGSVIKSIDGVKIANEIAAIVKIRSYAPGATITIVVDPPNSGASKTFTVTLGSAPSM
jgi:hypothetical protein